ncbi:MAG: GntR family transcriptional regulator [Ilumatobacteraceae bacterium]
MSTEPEAEGDFISAHERVASALREEMLDGGLPPGTILRENGLAEKYRVSRNTLREAFHQLAYEGLVTTRLYKGTTVRTVNTEDIPDLYIVRRTFELRAITEWPKRRDVHASLDAAVRAAEASAAAKRWREVGTASLRFHQHLVALLGSPTIDEIFRNILARLRLAFTTAADEAGFQEPWIERDRAILEALRAGRIADAEDELARYLDDSEAAVLRQVRAYHAGMNAVLATPVAGGGH